MIHTKTKDVITRTEALMRAFGWQGGTIHQVAKETGCEAHDLIYAQSGEHSLDNKMGWYAYRTNTLEFNVANILNAQQGNLQFWIGVTSGVQSTIKLGEDTIKKF